MKQKKISFKIQTNLGESSLIFWGDNLEKFNNYNNNSLIVVTIFQLFIEFVNNICNDEMLTDYKTRENKKKSIICIKQSFLFISTLFF